MDWTSLPGWIFGFVGVLFGWVNLRDASLYRKLDRPFAAIEPGGSGNETEIYVKIVIKNDPKGLWRLDQASVCSPGHARLSTVGSFSTDGYGGVINLPGSWSQTIIIPKSANNRIFVRPASEPVEILVTFVGRADPSQKQQSKVTVGV